MIHKVHESSFRIAEAVPISIAHRLSVFVIRYALFMKAVSYFGTGRTNRKAPCCNKKHCNRARRQQFACRFLHPDYTVGPGIAPGQHPQKVVADLEISHCPCTPFELFCSFGTLRQRKQLPYRQWGITPRPETNFLAQSITWRARLVKRTF